jgi:hypothetical protein
LTGDLRAVPVRPGQAQLLHVALQRVALPGRGKHLDGHARLRHLQQGVAGHELRRLQALGRVGLELLEDAGERPCDLCGRRSRAVRRGRRGRQEQPALQGFREGRPGDGCLTSGQISLGGTGAAN